MRPAALASRACSALKGCSAREHECDARRVVAAPVCLGQVALRFCRFVVQQRLSAFLDLGLRDIKEMAAAWVDKMKLVWEHRGEIADEFLKKWNAESVWARGLFQGEVLGWVMMTVLPVLITMGEAAPAAGKTTEQAEKKGAELITVAGYAQHPRMHPWLKNPDGAVRSVDEAVEIARAHGVEISDDTLIRKLKGKPPAGQYIRALLLTPWHRPEEDDQMGRFLR
jgi:hypothetical protein